MSKNERIINGNYSVYFTLLKKTVQSIIMFIKYGVKKIILFQKLTHFQYFQIIIYLGT